MGFRPRISDSRILTFLSDKLIRSKNDREKADPSRRNTPTYYMGERGSSHACCSHEYRHCSHGNSLQRLIHATRLELDRLFESKSRALCGSDSSGRRPRVPTNFDSHVQALDGGLAMALKIEEARSRGTNGHMARVFKDVTREVKCPTAQNYDNEMTIELYWVGPSSVSRSLWMQLKCRHLLQDNGTLSFKRLVDTMSAEFLGEVPLSLGVWDHTGCMILNDRSLEECVDDAARRGLLEPRWRVCIEDIDASSNGCLCCVYSQEDRSASNGDEGGDSDTISGGSEREVKEEDIKTKSEEWRAILLWTPQNSKIGSGEEVIDIWKQRLQSQKIVKRHRDERVNEWLTEIPCVCLKDTQEREWKLEARGRERKRRNEQELGEVGSGGVKQSKRRKMGEWGEWR